MDRPRSSCFKAYDVRGRVPQELDAELARQIARAFAGFLGAPRRVAVGHDIRLTSPEFARAVCAGLLESGVDVVELGCCGTEEVYFATFHLELDGGVMITASHNPADYNGLKLVREQARPISSDSGLHEIEARVRDAVDGPGAVRGRAERVDLRPAYVRHLLGQVDARGLRPLTVVVNAGNGGAGAVLDRLEPQLPLRLIKLHHEPDGRFPHGVPNPLLEANRAVTAREVVRQGADVGLAWDGDFDRCFFFDEQGRFVEGYYVVGLLAEAALRGRPGARIVHDPRLVWNTRELVQAAGGVAVQCKSGHAFLKEVMRREDAVYGGEMSAHHYFREFAYCDSGMLPWLAVLAELSRSGVALGRRIEERIARYPASGEINRRVADAGAALDAVCREFEGRALALDRTDGLGLEFADWRFNLRASNTEPLIRLNVETRGDRELLRRRTAEVLGIVGGAEA